MTAAARQSQLIGEYGLIDDPRERFQVIVDTAASGLAEFPESERGEENLVPGCVSKVWLATSPEPGGGVAVRIDSESPALRAIGALFCRIYSGAPAGEIVSTPPEFLERLDLDRHLTPTRRRGLRLLHELLVRRASVLAGKVEA